jgi:hypothetical protein
MARNDLVICTTNNGKVLIIDIRTSEIRRSIEVGNSPIVELAIIETQNRPSHPYLLLCTTTDRNLIIAETDSSHISTIDLNNMVSMSFGCGVGPKIVFCRSIKGLVICILNQSELRKELRVCSVELRKIK